MIQRLRQACMLKQLISQLFPEFPPSLFFGRNNFNHWKMMKECNSHIHSITKIKLIYIKC